MKGTWKKEVGEGRRQQPGKPSQNRYCPKKRASLARQACCYTHTDCPSAYEVRRAVNISPHLLNTEQTRLRHATRGRSRSSQREVH
jgi:hypothetical protein